MVEKEHDFRSAGAVDGCNALSDALIELGLLSGSGVWARFFSDCDFPGAFSKQNRANEVLPRHIVVVIELVLLQAEDVLFCLFFERERNRGKRDCFDEIVRFGSKWQRSGGSILFLF